MKKVLSVLLILTLMLNFASVCKGATIEYNGYTFTVNESYEGLLESKKSEIAGAWAFLKANDFNDEAIAGLVGNILVESWFEPDTKETGGSGYGLVQWSSPQDKAALKAHAETMGKDMGTIEVQLNFLVTVSNDFASKYKCTWVDDRDTLEEEEKSISLPVKTGGLEEYKSYPWSSASEAAEDFCWGFERPSFLGSNIATRMSLANLAYQKFSSSATGGVSGGVAMADGTVESLTLGSWTSQSVFIGTAKKLTDNHVTLPMDKSKLSITERQAISNWKQDINTSGTTAIERNAKSLIAFGGIIFLLYSVILYLLFWFDTVNVFFDMRLLSLATKGKLAVAPDEDSITKEHVKGEVIYIGSRGIATRSILGISVSILIISGRLLELVASVLLFIGRIF